MAIHESHVSMLETALERYGTDAQGLLELGKKAEKKAMNKEQLRVAMYLQVLAKKRIAGEI